MVMGCWQDRKISGAGNCRSHSPVRTAGYYFVPAGNLIAIAIVAGLAGIGYGAINLLPRAILADVADLERLNCGVERTGLLFALLTGFWKIGQAVSASTGLGRKAAVKFVSP